MAREDDILKKMDALLRKHQSGVKPSKPAPSAQATEEIFAGTPSIGEIIDALEQEEDDIPVLTEIVAEAGANDLELDLDPEYEEALTQWGIEASLPVPDLAGAHADAHATPEAADDEMQDAPGEAVAFSDDELRPQADDEAPEMGRLENTDADAAPADPGRWPDLPGSQLPGPEALVSPLPSHPDEAKDRDFDAGQTDAGHFNAWHVDAHPAEAVHADKGQAELHSDILTTPDTVTSPDALTSADVQGHPPDTGPALDEKLADHPVSDQPATLLDRASVGGQWGFPAQTGMHSTGAESADESSAADNVPRAVIVDRLPYEISAQISDSLTEQVLRNLDRQLPQVLEKSVAHQLTQTLDRTLSSLLDQFGMHIEHLVREAIAQELHKQLMDIYNASEDENGKSQ